MVIATVRIVLMHKKKKEALKILHSVTELTQFKPGCINCHIYQDMENENTITLEEIWETKSDLERHIRSEQYRKILAVIDMSDEQPDINFNWISHTSGLEVVKAVRE
ncbi:MAG TPA: antibiotic biosynthesis monooxygenase [Desulfobacteraceae bacterium]|nr:antibiotic biosynthesis monooxygenase [Desulfobacteraceae bacterium]HPJ67163.1 antibiotic biosynthesis monooxygenase [Desulfobacteraceae bacterium]HPQ29331.1 antibiotic biosynthesis monooxygenase [Desulfobacteraceae bacterium]